MEFSKEKAVMAIIIIVLLAIVISQSVGFFRQQALYAYAKSVPIQIGYQEAQQYWVLSSIVDEKQEFKMVLEDETSQSLGTYEEAKTKSEVGLLLVPLSPYSKTNMIASNIRYEAQLLPANNEKVPAFDINDAGWLTTALYHLSVYKNGLEIADKQIKINYREERVVDLSTSEGVVTVNNLGYLPQGVEVPSGDLVVVYDPDGNKHVWNKADLIKMVDDWNDGRTFPWRISFQYYSWKTVWAKTEEKGWLPEDVQLTHISQVSYTDDMTYITLTYGGIAFAGNIAVYIPDDLADTVIVQLLAPKPMIEKVTPDPLPTVNEGEKTVFWVEVKNTGTEGTVSISCTSNSYSFTPLTTMMKDMQPSETFIFKFEAYALNVFNDKEATVQIFVQGRGGSDSYTLKGTILNVEDYTPPIPDPTYTQLIVAVIDTNSKPVHELLVTVDTGGDVQSDTTASDGTVVFDLNKYVGDVKIVTQETAKYPSVTEIIKVELGTNKKVIRVGTTFPWLILILAIVIIVAVVAVSVYFYRKGI